MAEKFGLGFEILTRDQIEASITGNPFVEKHRLILRLDMAARSDDGGTLELTYESTARRQREPDAHPMDEPTGFVAGPR